MKIAKIRFRKLTGTMETNGPFWEERLLRPIDIYPEYRRGGRTEGGEQVVAERCTVGTRGAVGDVPLGPEGVPEDVVDPIN